jgi:group I intron endonuclease
MGIGTLQLPRVFHLWGFLYIMVTSGIYKIRSITYPERIYIGSAKDINGRWIRHKSELNRGIHNNKKLQNHVNKYGLDDLKLEIICICQQNELINMEQFYMDSFKTYFNILRNAYSLLNFKHSEETKEYLRQINLGHKMTSEQNEKNRLVRLGKPGWAKGKKFTESHRKNIAEAKKRKVINIETNEMFNSIGDAANCLGIKYQTLYAMLSDRNSNNTTLKFASYGT